MPRTSEVRDYYKGIVELVIGKWGYDGFKMDFSITNATGECYAPGHHHQSPAESFEALPELYKIISEETRRLKPQAILEMCPCGMFPSFYKMPYYNQPVASDPNSTWQIRHGERSLKPSWAPGLLITETTLKDFTVRTISLQWLVSVVSPDPSSWLWKRTTDFSGRNNPVWLDPGRRENFELWLKVYKDHRLGIR